MLCNRSRWLHSILCSLNTATIRALAASLSLQLTLLPFATLYVQLPVKSFCVPYVLRSDNSGPEYEI